MLRELSKKALVLKVLLPSLIVGTKVTIEIADRMRGRTIDLNKIRIPEPEETAATRAKETADALRARVRAAKRNAHVKTASTKKIITTQRKISL